MASSIEHRRAWRAANRDKTAGYKRKHRGTHLDQIRAAGRAASAARPDLAAQRRHRRRARQQGARRDPPSLMVAWYALLKSAPCEYCGGATEHVDHIVPLSRGGGHTVRNTAGSCGRCNLTKGARVYPDEWASPAS